MDSLQPDGGGNDVFVHISPTAGARAAMCALRQAPVVIRISRIKAAICRRASIDWAEYRPCL
jgi:hypothetical protein